MYDITDDKPRLLGTRMTTFGWFLRIYLTNLYRKHDDNLNTKLQNKKFQKSSTKTF